MKKVFWAVVAMVILATACTKDDAVSGGNDSLVSFTIDSPELQTRYGEGVSTNRLVYAFYDEAGNHLPELNGSVENYKTKTTIKVYLVEGRKYQAIFWADNTAAGYAVDFATKTMTINGTTLDGNSEEYDAFYNYTLNIDPADKTHTIELRRPFAQLNIATKDTAAAKAAGVEVKATKVEVEAYKTLTFDTEVDTTTGEVVPVANVSNKETFTYDWAPKAEGKAMTDYDMLSMNYVLVNARELVDVTLRMSEDAAQTTDNDATDLVRNYTTVPVQRNYRTYIVGNLLTTNNTFEVITDPRWAEPAYEYEEIADGVVLTSEGEYLLSNSEGLKWFANEVDDGTTFEGKTVKLAADITLPENENWNPIGDNRTDAAFAGTFDGQGHLISGAKITGDFCWDGSVYGSKEGWGLFSVLDGATVKNLKLDKEVFASYTVISGAVAGYAHDTTFENIEITNTKIAGYNWYTGGVVGWASGESTFKGINLANTTSVGTLWDSHGQSAGGIAGGVSGDAKITIEDCNIACVMDVINDVTSNYKWWIYRVSGMIIGDTNTTEGVYNTVVTATATNVTCKNVTVTYGDWMNYHYCEGYWNRGWGRVESSDYVGGIDHTQCNHPAGEEHYVCIPFDQLFGGSSNGTGHYPVKGLKEFPGVTVNYPPLPEIADGVALDAEGNYIITADIGMASISALIAADDNNFAGKTIKLDTDINLANVKTNGNSFAPIGSTGERDGSNRLICEPFKGTFDGQGHTIANLYQSGWDMGYEWGKYGSLGLFAELESATVKNVVVEGHEAQVEGGDISFIAGSATGTCVFEDITIKDSQIGTYNNGCGGIIGWSGAGNYTFKNIKLDSDVVLGGLWGSFDSSIGGVVGQAEPGATYNFENVEINCRIDAYNDCTASYDYYNYRMCGMIIGRCEETTSINGSNYPDLSKYNLSFNNVVVNYGKWMNYHYCEPTPGHNGGRGMRIEPGYAYDGLPENFDHTQCVDNHYNCIPFDQLIGGAQIGVKGLKTVDGVTVNYPAAYECELCGNTHNN